MWHVTMKLAKSLNSLLRLIYSAEQRAKYCCLARYSKESRNINSGYILCSLLHKFGKNYSGVRKKKGVVVGGRDSSQPELWREGEMGGALSCLPVVWHLLRLHKGLCQWKQTSQQNSDFYRHTHRMKESKIIKEENILPSNLDVCLPSAVR